MKAFVYIAGPYTSPDPVLNVRKALTAAEQIRDMGMVPFIPHLCHLWHLVSPHDHQYWMDYDLDWLQKCDVVYRIVGNSQGADIEVKAALVQKIPVYYAMTDLRDWFHIWRKK